MKTTWGVSDGAFYGGYVPGMVKKAKKAKGGRRFIPLNLGEHRARLGLSQARLGEMTDTTDATIGRIENGKQNWKAEFLMDAGRVLGVHWIELLPPQAHPLLRLWGQLDSAGQRGVITYMEEMVNEANKRRA